MADNARGKVGAVRQRSEEERFTFHVYSVYGVMAPNGARGNLCTIELESSWGN